MKKILTRWFYYAKPLIPRGVQLAIRRRVVQWTRSRNGHVWPIDESTSDPPSGWAGWPDGKRFALILTHDVDTAKGQDKCVALAGMEEALGLRSSFNFVPRRYQVSSSLRGYLTGRGFEVGVHGLYHDGKYFNSREVWNKRAVLINQYIEEWNAVGYRTPSMHHMLSWFHDLDIEYDASTFDTDPFEPYPDPVKTIFPFWVPNGKKDHGGYIELPYTLAQDFTLFILLQEKSIELWKKKLDWIVQKGGMALINTHPDYMNFKEGRIGREEYPSEWYKEFLEYVIDKYNGEYWHVLPNEVPKFWKTMRQNDPHFSDKAETGS